MKLNDQVQSSFMSTLTNSRRVEVARNETKRECEVKYSNVVAMIEYQYSVLVLSVGTSISTSTRIIQRQRDRGSFRSTAVACDASWLLRKGQGSCREAKKDGIPGANLLMRSSMQIA